MKKILSITLLLFTLFILTGCTTTTVTCGEGTIIKDGKCVAPDVTVDTKDQNDDVVSCDSVQGSLFYEANFENISSQLVDNEIGREHNASNFVVWGKNEAGQLLDTTSVSNGTLIVSDLDGTQLDPYYDTGLGYQYFDFETDTTYTVCAIVSGPSGQTLTSEIGIYYGHGTKDDVLLTGNPQLIIQDFRPTLSTNSDFGQFVIFTGRITGELRVSYIKIVYN
jgi:hypothetical protein